MRTLAAVGVLVLLALAGVGASVVHAAALRSLGRADRAERPLAD